MSDRIPTLSPNRLKQLLQAFRRARVLVVGDLMLDEFVWGKVNRISPEAPVPVVWVQSESVMPGGAANVANNIRALGGRVWMVGVVGTDRWGQALMADLAKRRIDTSGVLRDASRPTTVKTRVIAHHQQVVRVDREHVSPLDGALAGRLLSAVSRMKSDSGVVIRMCGGLRAILARSLAGVSPVRTRTRISGRGVP